MLRIASSLIAAALMTGLVTSVSAELQPPEGQKKEGRFGQKGRPPVGEKGEKGEKAERKGPPFGDRGDRKGPPMGRGFQLGKVLPPFAAERLDLSEKQQDQIAKLEKEVKAKLEEILSKDQIKKLSEFRPPMGPGGPGGPGFPPKGDRPGRGPGGPGGPPKGERPDRRPAEPAPMPRPLAQPVE